MIKKSIIFQETSASDMEMLQRISDAAETDKRSFSSEVLMMLEEYFKLKEMTVKDGMDREKYRTD
jgi:hypothetical protein